MIELGGVADFAQEAVGGDRYRELRVEHLDGDLLAGLVVGAEDARVATPADRRDHVVAVAQRLADPFDQVAARHRSLSRSPSTSGPRAAPHAAPVGFALRIGFLGEGC